MARPRLDLHPEAIEEARAARLWYADRSAAVANAFVAELDHAMQQILDAPDRWSVYAHRTRRYLLHRFPYMVVYRATETGVQVIAVAHARRKPSYWKARAV